MTSGSDKVADAITIDIDTTVTNLVHNATQSTTANFLEIKARAYEIAVKYIVKELYKVYEEENDYAPIKAAYIELATDIANLGSKFGNTTLVPVFEVQGSGIS